jgi:hypothetical protein
MWMKQAQDFVQRGEGAMVLALLNFQGFDATVLVI